MKLTHEDHTRSAFNGFIVILVMTLISGIAGYLFRFTLARNLSVAEYGAFYSIYAVFSIIFLIRDFGMTNALGKYLPEFIVRKDHAKLKSSVLMAAGVAAAISIVLGIITFLNAKWIAIIYLKTPAMTTFVQIMVVAFVFFSSDTLVLNVLTGFQEYWLYATAQFLRQVLPLLFALLLFVEAFKPLGLLLVSCGLIVTSIILLLLFMVALNAIAPHFRSTRFKFHKGMFNRLTRFGSSIVLVSIGGFVLQYTDTILITLLLGTGVSGIYNAAIPIASILIYVSGALVTVILPLTSELWAKGLRAKVGSTLESFYRYAALLLLPVCVTVFAFADTIILLLFGPAYAAAANALRVLIVGTAFYLVAQANFSVLSGINEPSTVAKMTIAGAIMNLILNIILIPLWGITGAAIATGISYVVMAIASTLTLRARVGTTLPWKRWMKAGSLSLGFLAVIFGLKLVLSLPAIPKIVITLLVAGVLYVLAAAAWGEANLNEIRQYITRTRAP